MFWKAQSATAVVVGDTSHDLVPPQISALWKPRKLVSTNDRTCTFPPPAGNNRVVCDDGASLRVATEAGAGIAMGSLWSLHRELKKGSLVRVLPDYEVNDGSAIWLVYPKSNVLTAKVRVFIDFLIEHIGSPPIWTVDGVCPID